MLQLFNFLNGIEPMSGPLQKHLESILEFNTFRKGQFIQRQGRICGRIYFITKGLVQIYHKDRKGRMITSWLLKEGDVGISINSFFKQQPSFENVVALEKTECYSIAFQQLQEIFQQFPEFYKHKAEIITEYHCRKDMHDHNLQGLDASERYALLASAEPDLLNRVPQYILASYIDLTERWFRKIRHQHLRNNSRS